MTKKIVIFSLLLLSPPLFAHPHATEHYIFHYNSGDVYDVKLTDNTITWTGLTGSDKGVSETDYMKRASLSKYTEVLQWSETSGSFVTVVFNTKNKKVVSSGKSGDETRLWEGTIE